VPDSGGKTQSSKEDGNPHHYGQRIALMLTFMYGGSRLREYSLCEVTRHPRIPGEVMEYGAKVLTYVKGCMDDMHEMLMWSHRTCRHRAHCFETVVQSNESKKNR
jgi:hypothetical protein